MILYTSNYCDCPTRATSIHLNKHEKQTLTSMVQVGTISSPTSQTFRVLGFHQSESRNCGLCVVYIQRDGRTLLAGAW